VSIVYADAPRAKLLRALASRHFPAVLAQLADACDVDPTDARAMAALSTALKYLVRDRLVLRSPMPPGRWNAPRFSYVIAPAARENVEQHYGRGGHEHGQRVSCGSCGAVGHNARTCQRQAATA
jgi:hypothetical protein